MPVKVYFLQMNKTVLNFYRCGKCVGIFDFEVKLRRRVLKYIEIYRKKSKKIKKSIRGGGKI